MKDNEYQPEPMKEQLQIELQNLLDSWPRVQATESLSLAAQHAKRIALCEWQLDRLNERERAA